MLRKYGVMALSYSELTRVILRLGGIRVVVTGVAFDAFQ